MWLKLSDYQKTDIWYSLLKYGYLRGLFKMEYEGLLENIQTFHAPVFPWAASYT